MYKLSLFLCFSSVLLSLGAEKPTLAAENTSDSPATQAQKAPKLDIPCNQTECTGNAHLASYLKNMAKSEEKQPLEAEFENLQTTPEGHLILEIGEEESYTAIEMFGCDCITSINALRQLRGIAVGVEGDRILPGPVIKPCNQPRAPQIP